MEEKLFFSEQEEKCRCDYEHSARLRVMALLLAAGEPMAPGSWDFLVPMLADHPAARGSISEEDFDQVVAAYGVKLAKA